MRKLVLALVAAALLPAALAAQKPGAPGATVGRKVPVFKVSPEAAINTAIARVRSDLAAGKLNAWGGGQGGGIKPSDLTVKAGDVATSDDGYVIAVTAPKGRGHVRVLVNRQTGAVVGSAYSSFSWGASPDWWVKGLNSAPPAEKKGEDTLSVKPRSGED